MTNETRILIVDDHAPVRKTITAMLRSFNFKIYYAETGFEALDIATRVDPDLILLDVMLPDISGFEVCRQLRENPKIDGVPVVMITALEDRESKLTGILAGADDFLTKPIDQAALQARVSMITRLNRYRRLVQEQQRFLKLTELSPDAVFLLDARGKIEFHNRKGAELLRVENNQSIVERNMFDFISAEFFDSCKTCFSDVLQKKLRVKLLESELLDLEDRPFPAEINAGAYTWNNQPAVQIIVRDITERKKAEQAFRAIHHDLSESYNATLEGWVRALDIRDHETEGHSQRVARLTLVLAKKFNFSTEDLDHIFRGALLHDIGKIGVPDHILRKTGKLNEEEWGIMRQHPVFAYQMLEPIPFLHPALDIAYAHHEKWDGSGYPRGIKQAEIPFSARIFAVIDVWDAMRSDRPYRKAIPTNKVIEEIGIQSGIHFDPDVVEAFFDLIHSGVISKD